MAQRVRFEPKDSFSGEGRNGAIPNPYPTRSTAFYSLSALCTLSYFLSRSASVIDHVDAFFHWLLGPSCAISVCLGKGRPTWAKTKEKRPAGYDIDSHAECSKSERKALPIIIIHCSLSGVRRSRTRSEFRIRFPQGIMNGFSPQRPHLYKPGSEDSRNQQVGHSFYTWLNSHRAFSSSGSLSLAWWSLRSASRFLAGFSQP